MTSSPISRFNLARRRVLLVSGSGATLYRFARGRVEEPLAFGADEPGVGAFGEYLRLSTPDPVYLMVDVVEEDFRLDTVPHVFGRDRSAVLENKRTRLFRDSRYTQAISQGRESEGRRDDRYLFTSIIRPDLLDPWLAELERLKVPLAGIYSLPVISGELVKRVPIAAENALLVSLQARGGLRQTFFDQGHLKVSRLAAMPRLEPRRMASYVLQEVERVRRYLNSMRLLNRNLPLEVYVLGHGGVLEDLARQATDTVTTRYQIVEIDALAQKLGAKGLTSGDQPYGDRLFAYLLARAAPTNYYASARETRYHTLHRTAAALTTVGVLTLVGGVGWSGFEIAQAFDKRLEIDTLARQAEFYEDRYLRGKDRLPAVPAEGIQIRRVVEAVGAIAEYREMPRDLMVVVSEGLDAFPELHIQSFDWEAGADLGGGGTVSPRPVPRGRRAEPSPASDGYFQAVRVQGRIDPFDGNYRLALEQVNRFAEFLGQIDRVHAVSILKRPLEVGSRERLSGVASATDGHATAEFEVRIVLRTHGEPIRS